VSTYTHTAAESPSFVASLYSYFALSPDDMGITPAESLRRDILKGPWPIPSRAVYAFSLGPDDPWAQLALQGNLVKLSPHKPGIFKAIVPCFEKRDFVRLKRTWLDQLAESREGEMIWVNGRREVGVMTHVVERSVLNMEEELGRQRTSFRGVPMYTRQREGTVKYTLRFDYLAMKTGY
jgi:hypothetical protein